jgi:hypothetical protein
VPETATWIDIGFTDVEVSKWSMDYGRTCPSSEILGQRAG